MMPLGLSMLHVSAQVRQLAEAKEAELNARLLQLESHIHWLSQDNQRLQEELQQAQQSAAEGAAAAQAAVAAAAGQQQKAAAADLAVSAAAVVLCHASRRPTIPTVPIVTACTQLGSGQQPAAADLVNPALAL
jgi:hypothetical protein